MPATPNLTNQEATMDFSTIPHGCLSEGTVTELGTIEQVSYTAYRISGEWVPFMRLHGPYRPVEGLVSFADGSRYIGR